MKNKKAQLTLFIILGILILIAGGIVFYYSTTSQEQEMETLPPSAETIKSFIDSCIDKTTKEGIYFIALQGGYYDGDSLSKRFFDIEIPYYWFDREDTMPTMYTIEYELSKYIVAELPNCVNFSIFENQGYKIEHEELSAEIELVPQGMITKVTYPLTIEIGTTSTKMSKFSAVIDLDIQAIYDIVHQIMEEQIKNPDSIPLGFISYLAYETNFTFEFFNLPNKEVLYSLIFKQNDGEPLVYNYLSQYGWMDASDEDQLIINPIPEFSLTEPELFSYQVTAEGQGITFYDYTDLFDIESETGWIVFDTDDIPNGKKNILIKAIDEQGGEGFTYMKLDVNFPQNAPIIEHIDNQTAFLNQEYHYQVIAIDPTDDFLYFLDDTSLFDINPMTGNITFMPAFRGNYSIKITAVNTAGHNFEYMNLEIK